MQPCVWHWRLVQLTWNNTWINRREENAISRPWSPSHATISTLRPTFKTSAHQLGFTPRPPIDPRRFPGHDQWILATSRTNSLQWSWVHQSIHSSESFPSKAVPLTICYFLKQGRNSPPFGFSLMQWWERFTNDSAFNADNGLESLKRKMWQKHIFSLSLPLAPTWFSVLGYFEDGNLELNIEYWSLWEVFKSRQIGFHRAHFNRVQWYLWNFSSAIHWGREIRCNTLNFRHLESFPHPESSPEFYNCRMGINCGRSLYYDLK